MVRKIILVGYMGAGKSTIAENLSKKLSVADLDLDKLIEKIEQSSVKEIFNHKGEIYFRKKEHDLLQSLLQKEESFVLSLGGGTPCYANNHLLLKGENIVSIYLKASIPVLGERLIAEKNKRPLLDSIKEEDLEEFISKHLFDRSFYYHQTNHIVLVDQKSPEEITE